MTDSWYSEDQATLGDRLAAARDAAGLTQAELSQRLGVRAKTLRDWENDLSEPRANRLQMLAALLGVSLRWLLTGEGDDVSPPDADAPQPDPALKQALADLRSLRGELLRMGEKLGRLEKTLRLQTAPTAGVSGE
ncbi:MAG: helix-turn-helix domain-containing protein [Rhodobacter sp.]|nr:helix-turn-helix domain-containing protein [Paracoccaceae bacterium]MCC0078904.1 helix-turn-helix domain-containing protein [Rhodobacter sp.]